MRNAIAITMALLVLGGGVAPLVAAGPADHSPSSTAPTPAASTSATSTPAASPAASVATETDRRTRENHPADPDEDVLGWEEVDGHGIWYNETIDVNNDDGVNQTELDLLVARTMARVEHVRQLEFRHEIPVSIQSREAYRANVTSAYANTSQPGRIHQNVKYEATFMIGEDKDAIEQLASNRASSVLGFYSPSRDEIVIISENTTTLQMDEFTLSHELAHALQDQVFNLSGMFGNTEDSNNAISGIVEGDAHYTEKLYAEKCNDDGAWNGTCIRPSNQGGGGGGGDLHVGVYLIGFQPYSDGPPFVHRLKQQGGWEAVNEVYDNPPASAEQVIHPEKYEDDAPANVTVQDRSNENWEILDMPNGSIDYATFGEAGLFSMFWYPSYRERGNVIVPYNHLFNTPEGGYDAYNYGFWASDGWDGDKLYPYVPTDESARDYENTGYVWKLEWDSERDAEQFVRGYGDLLNFYEAQPVDGRQNTYRIGNDGKFEDAFYVERQGTTVWIVNAPTVEKLSAIREGAAPAAQATTTTTQDEEETTTTDDDEETTTMDDVEATSTTTGTTSSSTPGFGPVVAVVALLGGALLVARRLRD